MGLKLRWIFFFLASGCIAWGTPAACNPVPAPGPAYNLDNTGADALVAPGGAGAGCTQINVEFVNFSYGNIGAGTVGSNMAVQFTGADESAVNMNVATAGWTASGSGGEAGSTTFFDTHLDPADVPPPPNTAWAITQLTLSANGANIAGAPTSGSDQVLVEALFCTDINPSCVIGGPSSQAGFGEIIYRISGTPAGNVGESCYNDGTSTPCTALVNNPGPSVISVTLGSGVQSITMHEFVLMFSTTGVTTSLSSYDVLFQQTGDA